MSSSYQLMKQCRKICQTLDKLREDKKPNVQLSEEQAEEQLYQMYWFSKDIADELRSVAGELKLINLPDIVGTDFSEVEFWKSSLISIAKSIEVQIDVLVHPNEVDIPKDIIEAHEF